MVKGKQALGGQWVDVKKVSDYLDVEGQSDYETEDELYFQSKAVRRLRRAWINPQVSDLMAAVDTYDNEITNLSGQKPKKMASSMPIIPHCIKDDARPPIKGLPRCFYEDSWFQSLDEDEKICLGALDVQFVIPSMVCPSTSLSSF